MGDKEMQNSIRTELEGEGNMENRLNRLFDFQKFDRNPRLDAMLSDTEGRYPGELTDEDLDMVHAAGDPDPFAIPMNDTVVGVRLEPLPPGEYGL